MKTFKYSILCEDDAHRCFVETFLASHFNDAVQFIFDEAFYRKFKCGNNSSVLKSYVIKIERSSYLNPYNLDLVFVGIDYDDRARRNFNNELEKLYLRLNEKARQKTIIFFPIQAIEHWLLMLQHKINNPQSTKNVADSIENIPRKEAKQQLFGGMSPENKMSLIIDLVKDFDKDWLAHRCNSFNQFYTRLTQAIG